MRKENGRIEKKNQDIRKAAKAVGLFLWQIAEKLEYSEYTMVKKMRKELPAEEKERIFGIIEELKAAEA